ncbi:alpha/beta fold hydrolase [Streptomyces morookaense]|uniref:alpha/beta fold hydrolase n=1 Tax=Streptomyces morookaense TaxID=1970 RepID=UPI00340D1045
MDDGQEQCHTINGFRIRCTIWEHPGSPLAPCLILPAAGQSTAHVRGHVRHLAPHMTCGVVELPGGVGADALPVEHGPDFLADGLRQVIDLCGLGPVNILGISAGTMPAYLAALDHPDRIARVALCGFHMVPDAAIEGGGERAVRLLRAGRLGEWADEVVQHLVCQDPDRTVRGRSMIGSLLRNRLVHSSPYEIGQQIRMMQRAVRHRNWFPGQGLRQPALFFTGEHDTATPPRASREAAALCADARVAIVKEADHMVAVQRPADVADLVTRFCSGASLENLPYCHPVQYFGSATPEATSSSAPAPA